MYRHILRLLFSPKAFAKKSEAYDTPEQKAADKSPETAIERAAWKQKAIRNSFILIFSLAVFGYIMAQLINTLEFCTSMHIVILRVISVSIVAWALMSKLSNNVDTMWGGSLLEKTNDAFFKLFYLVGFTLAISSMFLVPVNA